MSHLLGNNLVDIVVVLATSLAWFSTRGRTRIRVVQGRSERRYIRWFLDRYSTYHNPYLDDSEPLRLDRTYIPLSVQDGAAGGNSVRNKRPTTIATTTIGGAGNVVVVGDAGSGKTTTLKAYGVATVQGRGGPTLTPVDRGQRAVPFFVPISGLAASLRQRAGLAEHLMTDVLGAGAKLNSAEARELLSRLLKQRRCVVLLDGLDEVTGQDYAAVHDAVRRFAQDHTPELPTANARLVITCRHDNFLRLREGWVGTPDGVAERVYALAPLRDAEILSYLTKLADRFERFERSDGPEYFMAALRVSESTLDLHRTPLVLAMSVGLYARRASFEIPHSIAELYNTMIKEMLGRHAVGTFRREDKLRVLREFSLAMARGTGFSSFTREELVVFTQRLRPELLDLRQGQVDAFIDEIIERSGLVSLGADHTYEFAHRSIQEHLVASELLLQDAAAEGEAGGGRRELLERATDGDWRQVVLFYTAAADPRVVSRFLTSLAAMDVVLAGGCLAGADCGDDVAERVLDELDRRLRAGGQDLPLPALDAMLSATTSPRPTLRTVAAKLVYDCLTRVTNDSDAVTALGGNIDGVLRVVSVLVGQAREIGLDTTLVARLAAIVPDDHRLVAPLWRCLAILSAAGAPPPSRTAQQQPNPIVERLLMLAMDPACFEELQRQPAHDPGCATADQRQQAYPFRNGIARSSNLVTLLCWAEWLEISVADPNLFLKARYHSPRDWARIEVDRSRRTLSVPVPGRPKVYRLEGHQPLDRAAGSVLALLTLTVVAATVADAGRAASALDGLARSAVLAAALVAFVLSVVIAGVGVRTSWRRVDLWRANPFVDAYGDPRSRHWLVGEPPMTS